MLRQTLLLSAATGAAAHAVMYEPPNRNTRGIELLGPGCGGGSCLWFNQGCDPDCANCTGGGAVYPPQRACKGTPPKSTLNDEKLRTWNVKAKAGGSLDWTRFRPWRLPGRAPVTDPCGLAGGWYTPGTKGNGGDAPPGAKQGAAGSKLPKLLRKTEWVAGSTAEVAWAVYANHGGGYQYRLCPAGEALTEECFQKTPVEPIGDTNWIQYGNGMDVNDRQEIPAIRVTDGVKPAGSTWTRNPIPPCNDVTGGAFNSPCLGYQFTPLKSNKPDVTLAGFGGGACGSSIMGTKCSIKKMKKQSFQWGIVDKVKVPKVPPGDYVISFRWDSEQTPQVWSQCGDITIKASGTPSTRFTPMKGCDACCANVQGECAKCQKCANDKTGDCAECWQPMKGYNPAMVPPIQCLGGSTAPWYPGDEKSGIWSPDCARCWADDSSCNPDTPTGPAPAPAAQYSCAAGKCISDTAGVPLTTCQAACS